MCTCWKEKRTSKLFYLFTKNKNQDGGVGPATDPDIEKERECIVDATVVRIMKGKLFLNSLQKKFQEGEF